MKLDQIISPNAVVPDLKATEKNEVIQELIAVLVANNILSSSIQEEIVKKVLARERKGTTGFGKGVAVPHASHEDIQGVHAAVGVSHAGVDFNALDKQPVYAIVLIVSPSGEPDQHLAAMKIVFDQLQDERFRSFLIQADTVDAVIDLVKEVSE